MKKSNEEKRVVIYCRESRDDYGENYERIETQRDLLVKYCKEHGYTNIVEIIMDDDKSGTDFSRFDDIRKRAKNKEIDVIVFKNSARLGRNQKEALDFVDYLEENGVEIIFEDEQYNEEMFGLYAWFNERRARDDSKNIRRNLRHKIEEGDLLVKAIYGYEKVDKKLVVNEETSKIVKEIYDLYLKGWGYKKIATQLNKRGVPTPSQSRNFENAAKTTFWKPQHIVRILDERRYIGDYVGGHTEKVSFKSKKTRVKNKEEWTIIPEHHEAIIDKEIFERVQKIRTKRKRASDKLNNGFKFVDTENNLYSSLLYCGKCGTPMYKRKGTTGEKKRPDAYLCKKYSNEGALNDEIKGNYGCTPHRIRIKYLDEIVEAYIDNLISNPEFKGFVMDNVKAISTNKVKLESDLKKSKELLEKYQKQYKQVYEDKLNDLVPEFIYKDKRKELEQKIKLEEEKLNSLQDRFNTLNKLTDKEELIFKAIKDIKENGLTKEELSRLFDRIVVFDPHEITKEQKTEYNLNNEMYKELYENGGLAFHLKFMYPQTISNRGLRDWCKTN
ncbi:MAG: recombinase family protein [Clostridia bacterium]|nr:recombinase family protein [Clostridia bacterium]